MDVDKTIFSYVYTSFYSLDMSKYVVIVSTLNVPKWSTDQSMCRGQFTDNRRINELENPVYRFQ